METTVRPRRQDRLSELVTHLTGAPMADARAAMDEASEDSGPWGNDSLRDLAAALVSLRPPLA